MAVRRYEDSPAVQAAREGGATIAFRDDAPARFAVDASESALMEASSVLRDMIAAGDYRLLLPQGALEVRRAVTLPANTLVDDLSVVLGAYPAALTAARAVGQPRMAPPPPDFETIADGALIVDLGVPRTVTAVSVPSGFAVHRVRAWTGSGFAETPAFPVPYAMPADGSGFGAYIVLPSEVRTERLEIAVSGDGTNQDLIDGTILGLPDAPANLQLAIEGSGIVWRDQGIVTPGRDETVTDTAWNAKGERRVDLTAALRARLGDPTSADPVTLTLVLTSTAPGVLLIGEPQGTTRRIRRAALAGRSGEVVPFDAAGRIVQALSVPGLPADATVDEIRMTASATPKPPRTLPPVGPTASDRVTLTLDPDHALLVRLPVTSGLEALEALHVAATAGPAGAEIRALLWDSRVDAGAAVTDSLVSVPTAPFDAPASDPASLKADAEDWVRLAFPEPVTLPADRPLWAAILCSRGAATLAMTDAATPTPTEAGRVRVGPAAGPFQALPALFDTPAYAGLRARIRLTGTAPADAPMDPLAIGWPAAATVLPTKKGARVTLTGPAVAGGAVLDLVALAPMTLTLTDIDVVSDA
jgi:hypothetical protein